MLPCTATATWSDQLRVGCSYWARKRLANIVMKKTQEAGGPAHGRMRHGSTRVDEDILSSDGDAAYRCDTFRACAGLRAHQASSRRLHPTRSADLAGPAQILLSSVRRVSPFQVPSPFCTVYNEQPRGPAAAPSRLTASLAIAQLGRKRLAPVAYYSAGGLAGRKQARTPGDYGASCVACT